MSGKASPWARGLALVVLAATAFAVFAYRSAGAERAEVGRPAPDFTLPTLDGASLRLSDLRGRPAVIDFFASWCEVCELEAPVLTTFARRYGEAVAVVAIDWREPAEAARGFQRRVDLGVPVVRDADGRVAKAYGLTGVPETWVLAPDGTAVAHFVGGVAFEDVLAAVAKAAGAGWRAGSPLAGADDPVVALDLWGDRLVARRATGTSFISRDGGLHWEEASGSPGAPGAAGLPPGARLPAGVSPRATAFRGPLGYLASDQGVYVTQDGGQSWVPSGFREPLGTGVAMSSPGMAMLGEEPLQAWGVALAPSGVAYFAARSGVWVALGPAGPVRPLPGTPARAFRAVALSGARLWAITSDGDLYFTRLPAGGGEAEASAGPPAPDAAHLLDAGSGWYRVPVDLAP